MTAGLSSFFAILVFVLASIRIGNYLISKYWPFDSLEMRISASMAIGYIICSILFFVLCSIHLANQTVPQVIFVMLSGVALSGILLYRDILREWGRQFQRWTSFSTIILIYSVWVTAFTVLPVSERDALIYHLAVPKQLLEHSGFFRFEDNIYAYFPQMGEMLFLFALATAGEMFAKLIHLSAGFGGCLALYGFSSGFIPQKHALWAVVFFMFIPSVQAIFPLAYVDLFYTWFLLLALASFIQYVQTENLRWLIFTSIQLGAMAATKYTGFQTTFLFVILYLVYLYQKNNHFDLKKSAGTCFFCFLFVPFLFLLPYLVRNIFFTGWPFFPFALGHVPLRDGINWDPNRARLFLGWLATAGTMIGKETVWDTVLAPILVFIKGRFNDLSYYDGILGPLFLLTPVVLLKTKRGREVNMVIIFCLLFFYCWSITTKQIRFLIPVMPFVCFLLAYGLQQKHNLMIKVLTAGLLLANVYMGIKEVWKVSPLNFWMGKESREQFLSRQIPFDIYRFTNENLRQNDKVYLVNTKNYTYYLKVPWTADFVFESYRIGTLLRRSSMSELNQFFASNAVTHLIVNEAQIRSPQFGFDETQLKFWEVALKSRGRRIFGNSVFSVYEILGRVN